MDMGLVRRTERGRTCFQPGKYGLNLPICARAAALPCGGANERPLDLSQIPRDLLELQICAVVRGQMRRAASTGADDRSCTVTRLLAQATGGHQRGAAPRSRP